MTPSTNTEIKENSKSLYEQDFQLWLEKTIQ